MATSAPKVNKRPKPPVPTGKVPNAKGKDKEIRKPRKPALERAVKMVSTLERKCGAFAKNVSRWHAQDSTYSETVNDLKERALQIKVLVEGAAANVGDLVDAGAVIETAGGGSGGRRPMTIGDGVILRANRYAAAIHGPNDFEIVDMHEQFYQIKSRTNGERHYVPRQWIKRQTDDASAVVGDEGADD